MTTEVDGHRFIQIDHTEFLEKRNNGGVDCPCCGQLAKVYKRRINSGMARALIELYKAMPETTDSGFIHFSTLLGSKRGDESKLVYWGLIEESVQVRGDQGRAGYWRITDKGRKFIDGKITVPKYALIYNARFLGFDDDNDQVTIHEALGEHFKLNELMAR